MLSAGLYRPPLFRKHFQSKHPITLHEPCDSKDSNPRAHVYSAGNYPALPPPQRVKDGDLNWVGDRVRPACARTTWPQIADSLRVLRSEAKAFSRSRVAFRDFSMLTDAEHVTIMAPVPASEADATGDILLVSILRHPAKASPLPKRSVHL